MARWGAFGVSRRVTFTDGLNPSLFNAQAIGALPNGDYILGGEATELGLNNRQALMRVRPDGTVVWARRYSPGQLNDAFNAMVVTPDDAVCMVGRYREGTTKGALICKVDFDGNVLWTRLVRDEAIAGRTATGVVNGPDGTLLVMGHRGGINIPDPAFLVWSRIIELDTGASNSERYHGLADADGNVISGGAATDRARDLAWTGAGFAMVGDGGEATEVDGWIWSIGATQSLAGAAVYDSPDHDTFTGVSALPDGGLLSVGWSDTFGGSSYPSMLIVRTGAMPYLELGPNSGGTSNPYALSAVAGGGSAELIPDAVQELYPTALDHPLSSITALSPTVTQLTD